MINLSDNLNARSRETSFSHTVSTLVLHNVGTVSSFMCEQTHLIRQGVLREDYSCHVTSHSYSLLEGLPAQS